MSSDNTLLQQYATDQNAEAFAELVRRHAGLVYAAGLRVTANSHEAEDVAQECFLELARQAASIQVSLPGWLHRVATRRAINAVRRQVARKRREEEAVSATEPGREPGWKEIAPLVDQALDELDDELREPLVLHYFQGLTQIEIAERLGVGQATVSRRMDRSVGELRAKLAKAGVVASVAVLTGLLTQNAAAAPTIPATLSAALGKLAVAGVAPSMSASASGSTTFTLKLMETIAAAKLKFTVAALIIAGAVAIPIIVSQQRKQEQMPKPISMPAPAPEPGNTYARGMSAVLRYLGTDATYDQVMGLTGVAFILQVDTGGPFVDGELDSGWWPNDAWGFDLGLPVLSKAVGWDLRPLRCNEADAAAEYRRSFAPAVEQSLVAGKPVLAEHDHCFIVTGIDGGEPPLLGYGTSGKSTQFAEVLRIASYPWGLIVFGERSAAVDPAKVDLASLRHIMALYNEQAQGADAPKTRFSGRQAWAEWLRLLRAGSACDNNMLIHLRYNRGSAVAYLREMVKRHNGGAATHLAAAADVYQRIVDEVMKQGLPYNRVQNGEPEQTVRAEYTAMVQRVSQMEAQAMAELAAAADAIEQTLTTLETKANLKREGDRVWIEGVEKLAGWGQGKENTFLGSLTVAMHAIGEKTDYDYLMGVSGQAFRIQIHQPDWSASAPDAGCGFNCMETAMHALGYTWSAAKTDPQKDLPDNRKQIVESIRKGVPVVAMDLDGGMDWGVIAGYSQDGRQLLCRTYQRQDDDYTAQQKWPWLVWVIEDRVKEPDRKTNVLDSLKLAVELARTRQYGEFASGFAAFEVWIRDLEDDARFQGRTKRELADMLHSNAWCYYSLFDARASASRYLRSIAGEFPKEVADHLFNAVRNYEEIAATLQKGQPDAPFPSQLQARPWTQDMRDRQADILTACEKLERQAIAELDAALAGIQN